jgi:large subunit ribosomal protein L21
MFRRDFRRLPLLDLLHPYTPLYILYNLKFFLSTGQLWTILEQDSLSLTCKPLFFYHPRPNRLFGGSMYAIIETGGKQYRVEKGDIIDVELLEAKEGKVEFNQVVFVHNDTTPKVGCPHVAKSIVRGELVGEVRGPKVLAFKYKRRKGIRSKIGHRQDYSRVKITEIVA